MNFCLSLFIYNPLEVFILIYFCSLFSKVKIDKNIIKHCYILGTVNLLIQYIATIIDSSFCVLSYNVIAALVICPITLYLYSYIFISGCIKIKICICSSIYNFLTLYLSLAIIDSFGIFNVAFNIDRGLEYEFFVNLFIKVLQIIILFIIKYGVDKFEKIIKENCHE